MSPPQNSLHAIETVSQAIELEFAYEPVFWARTQAILAYEQLARRPGDFDASFLSELTQEQTSSLDNQAIDVALAASSILKTPVFVNAFPENVEAMARRLSLSTEDCIANVGLEVNEDLPIDQLVACVEKYPDIWWILDDLDLRKDSFDTVAHPLIRSLPLTAKFHYQCSLNSRSHNFDMNLLPSHWMVIVEGVKKDMVSTMKRRGISFIQGRDLGSNLRDVTPSRIFI